MKRAAIIVLDGLGIGESPSTARYGDAGSDTLGNVARVVGGLALPNLERLGLGCCRPLQGIRCPASPGAATGIALNNTALIVMGFSLARARAPRRRPRSASRHAA